MKPLCDILFKLDEVAEIARRIENKRTPVLLSGLAPIHKAHLIAAIRKRFARPVVMITRDERAASRILGDASVFTGEEAVFLAPREFVFYNADSVSREYEQKRLAILSQAGKTPLLFMSAESAAARTIPPAKLEEAIIRLKVGDKLDPEELCHRLTAAGYTAASAIDARSGGQFSRRGGIVDIYPVNVEYPCRVDFFDDEIDSLANFNTDTQRRTETLMSIEILPAAELLPSIADGGVEGVCERLRELRARLSKKSRLDEKLTQTITADIEKLENNGVFASIDRLFNAIYPEFTTALDYIPENAIVFLDEPSQFADKMKNMEWQNGEDIEKLLSEGLISGDQADYYMGYDVICARLAKFPLVEVDNFTSGHYDIPPKSVSSLLAKELPGYAGGFSSVAEDIKSYLGRSYAVILCCGSAQRATLASEALREEDIEGSYLVPEAIVPIGGKLIYTDTAPSVGVEYPALKLVILTEGKQTSRRRKGIIKPSKKDGHEQIKNYSDLHPGDLVVHDAYGIGRFVNIEPIEVDGIRKDYIKIQYFGSDVLYVPVTQLDLIAKYIGASEESGVKLNRMGGGEWNRTKAKAKGAARDLAKQLIALYAARAKLQGFAFPQDSEWQREFEESFEYDETDDQLRTTDEIKRDMEKSIPMDRLLCGDVGFGKTEVALRAVMKCVMGGKQAAILVPTTVLARQHYQTAMHRFRNYPVKIGVLSRFTPPAKAAEYMRQMKNGSLDLVIGTHKLLGKSIGFNDLGLLVVDEEQRFGVSHKERLKELARTVDVLTLTATPIPRTLNMAMSGIRDMSILEEAPHNRHPVQTYVLEHDWGVIADAITRELSRGGQVYYLHNRVDTITRTAAKIKELFPEASIAIGHGQMKGDELADIMHLVVEGEVQILVCTTIIETGIDIPNVNTLIIDEADRMGLAQLHQIRGRVGRSSRHAYAYLTYNKNRVLSEVATKRLSTIREFAEFGAGFRISMRDLEIRGAGNVLGAEQSGHMITVGYDMYLRLLDEAVVEEKGEAPKKKVECLVDILLPARIKENYIPLAAERLDIYRRIAYIRSSEDAEDMTDELIDRYGEFGSEVQNLIDIALLRNRASSVGVYEINERNKFLNFKLKNPDFMKISAVYTMPQFKGRILLNAGNDPYLSIKLKDKDNKLALASDLVAKLCELEEGAETE